jgi:TetR/AcrR family transcriptional regulator, ethionamide resistance regulator
MRVNREARAAHALQRRAATRERLLDAALDVVAARGPEGVPIDEFAAAAGVSRGTFYNYFPTVADLLHALTARIAAQVERRFDEQRLETDEPAAALGGLMHRVWSAYVDDPRQAWVGSRLESAGAPRQAVWERLFRQLHARGVLAGRFRAVDVAAAQQLTFGALRMAVHDLYLGQVSAEHGVPLVALLLAAYGVPADEAEAISRREAAAAGASAAGAAPI